MAEKKVTYPLVFLHIPKTAGTTFRSVIERNVSEDDMSAFYKDKRKAYQYAEDYSGHSKKLILGHFEFIPSLGTTGTPQHFTILRDPVKRVISHFRHLERSKNERHQQLMKEYPDFESFLGSDLANNLQTKYVSGYRKQKDFQANAEKGLEIALQNIRDHFLFTAVTEEFDESLVLMRELLGWNAIFYTRENVGAKQKVSQPIPDALIPIIQERNQLDQELYNFSRERLHQQLSTIDQFPEKLERFRRENAVPKAPAKRRRNWLSRFYKKR